MNLRAPAFCGVIAAFVLLSGSSIPAQPAADPSVVTGRETMAFLNQTIDWYRQIAAEEQSVGDPSDGLFVTDERQVARQILRLSFDFARAEAQLILKQTASGGGRGAVSAASQQYADLLKAATDAETETKETQAELASVKQKLTTAPDSKRRELQATVDELESEIDLSQTRGQTLRNILQYATAGGGSGSNLLSRIDELQRSIPEVASDPTKEPTAQAAAPSTPVPSSGQVAATPAEPSGMLNLATSLLSLNRKLHSLDRMVALTETLAASSQKIEAPLVAKLEAAAERGEQLAKQADSSNAAQLAELKRELDALTAGFKQSSNVAVPMERQSILFDLYKRNLTRWRGNVQNLYSLESRSLTIRLTALAFTLIVLFALAEVWRRAAVRYVSDIRRRYQLLVLRRVVLWIAIGITVAFSLATEIGSLATFAGLITAGLAVALQSVILAIAGYFFLIGKYGVRVGDRVQISGVTGNVLDIGLIRIHLMELAGAGSDRQPTGRIVVFSNAIVFQPAASFFKQIPGTNFGWHEVTLILSPDSDFRLAEKRMLAAVDRVYSSYREKIEQQAHQIERNFTLGLKIPQPKSRLRLTQAGLEVVIRYPLELDNSTEVDDQITRELLDELGKAPKLKLVGTGVPNIQPVVETTTGVPAEKVIS